MILTEILRRLYYFNIYRKLKIKGKNIRFSRGGSIARPEELTIGSNVFIGKGFIISAWDMYIGSNVMIGPNLLAECDNHSFNEVGHPMFEMRKKREKAGIVIEDDVWIGGHVILLKGVIIGEGSVIGAGSVVTKNVKPYSIYAGNPAKYLKPRFNSFDELILHRKLMKKNYNFISKYNLDELKYLYETTNPTT